MNEDQFRKMLDALVDGLWYDVVHSGVAAFYMDQYENLEEAVMRHIGTGVLGTPAEAWLKSWREGKPPLTQPLDEKDNSE